MDKKTWICIGIVAVIAVVAICFFAKKPMSPPPAPTGDNPPAPISESMPPAAPPAPADATPDAEVETIAESLIHEQFDAFGEGFRLESLTLNPQKSADPQELEYVNTLEKGKFDRVLVYDSEFYTPSSFGDEIVAWEPDTQYTWTWYVAHDVNGEWILVTFGY